MSKTTEHFILGTEGILEPQHIGRLITVEHAEDRGCYVSALSTQIGRLVGWSEEHGETRFGHGEAGDRRLDLGAYPDPFSLVRIYFEHGSQAIVRTGDVARITVHAEGDW